MDGSQTAIDKMNEWLNDEGFVVASSCCDFSTLPFKDGTFAGAVDIMSIAHNSNYDDIYAEVARVLKPNGKLLSIVPDMDTWKEPFEKKGFVNFFSYAALRLALAKYFNSNIGWYEFSSDGTYDKSLKFWVVDATKK